MQTKTTGEIVNRVAASPIVVFNPEDYRPKAPVLELDIKDWLFHGLILKEKDFRAHVDEHDFGQYADAWVALTCSADAIVPDWAYMLLATKLAGVARGVAFATKAQYETQLLVDALKEVDYSEYAGRPVVVKGCGGIPPEAYAVVAFALTPHAKSVMYGEPCSTVPLYKRKDK